MAKQGHPKGLYLLFVTEMAERFSYYGMRALFVLYLVAAFFNSADASQIYGSYTGLVYLTPLLGGYIADRYWGNRRSIIFGAIVMAIGQFLMFASACVVQQSIFSDPATGGAISDSVNNGLAMTLMFIGLGALIIGNGFFKPNISTMVGDLYAPQDHRKDSAFTIFYMGINTGALIAPLVCGSVSADGNWMNPGAFKWGFFCAGIAMIFSVVVFILGKKKYLNTPEGLPIGLPPSQSQLLKQKDMKANEEELHQNGEMAENNDNAMPKPAVKNSPLRLWGCLIGAIALFIVFSLNVDNFNDYISAAIYAISIALPLFIITDKGLTIVEKQRIGVIYIIAVFVIFFWSAFEQAGSSLTIFADQQCDRTIGNWEAIGLLLLAIGYAIIAFGTNGLADGQKASMWWLFALYFIHTIGELSLSPIGLSMVNKLSPAHLASLLMGVWFMSNAASNILAGKLATLLPTVEQPVHSFLGYQITNLTDFFTLFAIMAGAAAILLFCLCPLLKKMMKGVE